MLDEPWVILSEARIGDTHPHRALRIEMHKDGDVEVAIIGEDGLPLGFGTDEAAVVEFCSGGGRSPKVRGAVADLVRAIRADNRSRPDADPVHLAELAAQRSAPSFTLITRDECLDLVFDLLVDAARKSSYCPTSKAIRESLEAGKYRIQGSTRASSCTSTPVLALARSGRIRIELYGRGTRVIEILQGEHMGARTAPSPYGGKPYRIIETPRS